MKFLVDPLLVYLLLQVAGLLIVRRRIIGWSRGIVYALLLATLCLGVVATPLLSRGLKASLVMPPASGWTLTPAFIVVLGGGYGQGKTVEELKEIAVTLQAQVTENQKLANHHQMMATKAQGALEVMLQMIPKEEVEKMIAQENRSNGEVVEG